jgi:hypothetical protein
MADTLSVLIISRCEYKKYSIRFKGAYMCYSREIALSFVVGVSFDNV